MQTLSLPRRGRDVVSRRPSAQVQQIQIIKKDSEKNKTTNKESSAKSVRKKIATKK